MRRWEFREQPQLQNSESRFRDENSIKIFMQMQKREKSTRQRQLKSPFDLIPALSPIFPSAFPLLLLRICVKNVEQTIFIIDFHVCHGKASMAVDRGGGVAGLGGTLVNLYQKRDTQKSGGGETPRTQPPTHPQSQGKAETNAMCVC